MQSKNSPKREKTMTRQMPNEQNVEQMFIHLSW